MVQKIADIRTVVTQNELEALLLENSLIKEHQPRYNVNLKDDKTYPWIVIKKERFPRIFYTRKRSRTVLNTGPYPSVKVMKAVLELVRQIHPIRNCKLNLTASAIDQGKFQKCLEYHIGNCLAPCEALQSESAYQYEIDQARQIINGKLGEVKRMLGERMKEEASAMRFEQAQKIKEKVELLEQYQARSTVVNPSISDVDVFTAVVDAQFGYVNYLKVVDGAILHTHTLEFRRKLEETESELLALAIPELRKRFGSGSKEILTSHQVRIELTGVDFHRPQRGDKKRLVDLSIKNVRYFRLEKLKSIQITDPERHVERVMEQMRTDLRLEVQPRHIECFDNSNFQGSEAVCLRGLQERQAGQVRIPALQCAHRGGTGRFCHHEGGRSQALQKTGRRGVGPAAARLDRRGEGTAFCGLGSPAGIGPIQDHSGDRHRQAIGGALFSWRSHTALLRQAFRDLAHPAAASQ